jgi:ligand-binding sensor domain-containing protein/signal transduction histidine kinase
VGHLFLDSQYESGYHFSMRRLTGICIPLLCGLFAVRLFAFQQPRFERISTKNGLSQNTVFGIAQDQQGFMWFSTQEGVNRYDGHTFTVLRQDLSDSNSLSNNFCGPLLVDRRGRIWIGTEGSGVDIFDPRTKRFRNLGHDTKSSTSLIGNVIAALSEDAEGRVWVGTRSGLSIVDPEKLTARNFRSGDNGLPGDVVGAFLNDRYNRMWVGTSGGAALYDKDREHFLVLPFDDRQNLQVQGLAEDGNGVVWVATTRGLYKFDSSRQELLSAHPFFKGKDLGFILPGEHGALWIGSQTGLIEYHPIRGTVRVHSHNSVDATSLSSNAIISALRDRSGVLWFGTFTGINRYAPVKTKFASFRHSPDDKGSLSNSNVRSFCEDQTGSIWIATLDGLNRFRKGGTSFNRYYQATSGLSSNQIWSVREQQSGTQNLVWAGTNAHGINEISFTPWGNPLFRHHLPGRSIASVAVDAGGVVWAGDLNGEIYRFDSFRKKFEIVPIENSKRAVALYVDRNHDLWIGTLGNGAIHFRQSTGEVRRFRNNASVPTSLSNDHAISFCEDTAGTMWIGTYAGLNRIHPDGESFSRYTTRDGLPNDVIYGILCDDRGRLWLSTNRGISSFDPSTSDFRNFDVSDGLQENEFNQGAAYKAKDGTMYFGGINGFSVFHPDSIPENKHAPSVVITNFRIFNKPVQMDTASRRFTGPIEYAKSVTLSYNENVFSFEFAALEYTNPEKNRYAYMMEGFDEQWIDAGNKREATYTNLGPGTYTFRVRAANNDGMWNRDGVSVAVVITPPFWMTWWFRGIMVLTFLSVGPFIYFRRVNALKKERRQQQEVSEKLIASQEAERKRIAGELHDSVGQDLLIIKNKILLGLEAQDGSTERTKEFKDAADYVSKSLMDVREISRNLRPIQLDQLGLTAALESVIETVAHSAHLTYSSHLENVNNKLSRDQEIHLFRIVQEGLNNIVKHSGASSFAIKLVSNKDDFELSIADNGRGMNTSLENKEAGFGLSGMRERARILGGTLEMRSEIHKGTTVILRFRLREGTGG